MRCVQDKSFSYIFNPWSDGKQQYRNNNEGETLKAMVQAGKSNPQIQERVDVFRYRTVEEFYDLKSDPNCLHNLIVDKAYTKKIKQYRQRLQNWMQKHGDPMLPVFSMMSNPEEMRRLLESVYHTILKPGKFEQRSWAKRIEEMKKNNFE